MNRADWKVVPRILAALVLSLVVASVHAARTTADLAAIEAYACTPEGVPLQPGLGDSFHVALRYRVIGTLTGSYSVRIETAYARLATPQLTLGVGAPGEYTVIWGPLSVLMDRPIEARATLVAGRGTRETTSRNNTAPFSFLPRRPAAPIEYYAPRQLEAETSLEAQWVTNPGTLEVWLPSPASQTFQEVLAQSVPGAFAGDLGGPLVAWLQPEPENRLLVRQYSTSVARRQRADRDVLRLATWDSYGLEPSAADWLGFEELIPANHPEVAAFAARAARAAASPSPYDVAEAVYLAVLQRTTYSHRPGNSPSALLALRRKKADCGGLSALFVAACRSLGIPARPVTGFGLGDDQWHVWAEFLIPGYGWVACDPAFAEGASPSGRLPLYFGVMPDLDRRLATGFGFQQSAGGRTVAFLQAPTVFWENGSARLLSAASHASLR